MRMTDAPCVRCKERFARPLADGEYVCPKCWGVPTPQEQQERRELYKEVALSAINKGADWDAEGFNPVVADCTENILKAAYKFGKGE